MEEHYKVDASIFSRSSKILILGGVDVGKTYLAFSLISQALKYVERAALICADLGQACVGPPGCISFRVFRREERAPSPVEYIKPDFIEFIGSLSPAGCLASFLIGLEIVLRKASGQAPILVINTTGYIHSREAFLLKLLKIRLVSPEVILAIQRKEELEPLLEKFSSSKIKIYRFKRYDKIRRRTKEKRAQWREFLFKEYFKKAKFHLWEKDLLLLKKDMVVGLLNSHLETVSLGKIGFFRGRVGIYAPIFNRRIKFIKSSEIVFKGELS